MAMSPFALTMFGMETVPRRRTGGAAEENSIVEAFRTLGLASARPARSSGRPTSHYNSFQTTCSPSNDEPPKYALAAKQRAPTSQSNSSTDMLPGYSCDIKAEAKVLLQLESINPLHGLAETDWRELYVVVRGTLLSLHRVKDGGPGKLLRAYTLQHAEVGLATDTQHTVLVPQTRLAHLIPTSTRRKAWRKDPTLFQPVRQHILRLRIETDQILLANASESLTHNLIHAIGSGIDVACPIDERSIPRQCTVPRRRRRQRVDLEGTFTDPSLLAEQERILRDMYPAFAERATPQLELQRTTTSTSTVEPMQTPAREEDEIDLSVMREYAPAPDAFTETQSANGRDRPAISRQITVSSVFSATPDTTIYATEPANFDQCGKWQPPHPRTAAQIQRYVRRCMPVLLADATRASNILICSGKRVKINWRMELLEEWELSPPSYRSHRFKPAVDTAALERTKSNSSQSPSTETGPRESGSVLGGTAEDRIEPMDTGLTNLDMAKSATADQTLLNQGDPFRLHLDTKVQEGKHTGAAIQHGVAFCF